MDEIAERLGRLCAQAEDGALRERAAQYGAADVLERLTRAIRLGATRHHLAADLDALDEVFARHGIDGLTSGPRAYEPWRGGDAAHPLVATWACPARQPCSRLAARDDAARRPRCALGDRFFVARRIPL